MIVITEKQNCCGCSACVQVCPKQCISFDEDENGFRYPIVDKEACIDCGLCEKVCPCLNPSDARKPFKVYAAKHPDVSIRKQSSSGGVFSLLAEKVINEGGVVFGARFNADWEVVHAFAQTIEEVTAFRGSKYVQSLIGETYKQAQEFLKQGRQVLFTGTSCQIAGLKLFLRKEYDNLITVDVVCHGVPSALVWRKYLEEKIKAESNGLTHKGQISAISFRDKTEGWFKFGLDIRGKQSAQDNQEKVFLHESKYQSLYLQAFIKNLCLRDSCHNCPSKCGKSHSDITLADYWFIGRTYPEMDDDKGTSLVLLNTVKGQHLFNGLNLSYIETSYVEAYQHNSSLEKSKARNEFIPMFWQTFHTSGFSQVGNLLKKMKKSLFARIVEKLKGFFR